MKPRRLLAGRRPFSFRPRPGPRFRVFGPGMTIFRDIETPCARAAERQLGKRGRRAPGAGGAARPTWRFAAAPRPRCL